MSQTVEILKVDWEELLEKFRSKAHSMPSSNTSSRYLRAVDSFSASIAQYFPESDSLTSDAPKELLPLYSLLADWAVEQWLSGTAYKTFILYLDILSALYSSASKDSLCPATKAFFNLKTALKTIGEEAWNGGINNEIFERALRLTKNAGNCIGEDAVAAGMVLWILTHGCTSLKEISTLKREDIGKSSLDDDLSYIFKNPSLNNPRRKYVFPLGQAERTPRQVSLYQQRIIKALFRRCRLPQADNVMDTIESIWAYAALRLGIDPKAIVDYLGHAPLGLPVLKLFVVRCELSGAGSSENADSSSSENAKRKTENEYFTQIGNIFFDNPLRWYAMSLRPGVRFPELEARICHLSDELPPVELFYPCEEIAKAIGKKIVYRQRPFIRQVVFFQTRVTDIVRIFSKIGDLAWCYRQTGRPGSPYAEINPRQFELFQQTISRFTPDYEVASSGDLLLKPNDRVKVIGGLFNGMEAEVEGVVGIPRSCVNIPAKPSDTSDSHNGQRTTEDVPTGIVYRLNLIGDNGIEWRVTVDPRLITPSEKS